MRKKELVLLSCMLISSAMYAQKRVYGVVQDDQQYPMPGVTIMEQGTSNGVITDVDGNFSIEVANNESVLVFSFVGMTTEEVLVGDRTSFNITMRSAISDLDEVVVIGYGVQKKRLVTGANIQVSGEDIQKLNTVSALGALQSQS